MQWFLSGQRTGYVRRHFNGDSGTFHIAPVVNTATAIPVNLNDSPGTGTGNIPTNCDIYLEFSQPLNSATVIAANVYLYDNTAGTYPTVTLSQPEPNVIELAPSSALTPGHEYYACANGNVQGTNGVATTSGCWDTNFNAGTATDTTAGTVTIGPPNGSVNVGTNAYIRVLFSKPFNRALFNQGATANAKVTVGGNPVPGGWSFGYNSGTNDAIEAYFSPTNPLPPSTTVSVSVSGVLDYAGNTFTAKSASFTTAALPDYNTPSVSLDFGGNTYNIGTNASFTCLYSAPMDPSSVTPSNTYVYSYTTNATIPVTYTWASDLMSVTMTPKTALFANAEYYYECTGAIDLTGNGESNGSSYFYTGNGPIAVGPSLVYANPPSGSTNVPLNSIGGPWNNTSLMLLFNKPVSSDSMNNITFTPQGGSAEPIAVYAEDGNYIADVQLPYTLTPNTTYTFNFAGVTDLSGNPATGTTTSSFTTGSGYNWNQPTVSAVTPVNSATGVAVTVQPTITFSTLMNPALIDTNHILLETANTQTVVPTTIALSVVAGQTVVTLTPTVPLAESTIYVVGVSTPYWDLYDQAGNSWSASGYIGGYNIYVFSVFTTGTTSAVNGACGTASGGSFSAAPTANLCSSTGGTPSAVTNVAGAWSWTCNGEYGGTNAPCSATITGLTACLPQASVPGLVSLWPGNNNATDFGPGGNNGTLENGVTYGLGETGDAFSLSGSDQYVLIGQPVPTNLQIQNAFTLSAWIYPTAIPTDYGSGALGLIVGSQEDNVYGGTTIFFDGRNNPDGYTGIPPGHIHFQIGDGSEWHSTDTQTQLPLNQWTLVTATRVAGGPPIVYYNGVSQPLQTVNSWSGVISYPTSDWFAIGQEVNENRPFTGLINDVMVSNQALTAAQVLAIYNAGNGGICQ